MRKIIELPEKFDTGEDTCRVMLAWGPSGKACIDRVKTASEASDYVVSVKPQPGKTIVLLIALGSYSAYDVNKNGDGFPDTPYKQGIKPLCGCCPANEGGWIGPAEIVQQHYKTFEQNGHVYLHHANKDPAKSVGDVIKAFWNDPMKRVELLVGVDNFKAPELVQRITDREYPAWSMGTKVLWDVCTHCGHRAPTRKEYCTHARDAMRQVGKNGLRHGVLNPSPRFFDISAVIKPADLIGMMLKKVAHTEMPYEIKLSADLGEYLDNVEAVKLAVRKTAE